MKIVIDAMGSDNAPYSEVNAAIMALDKNSNLEIILVGDEQKIYEALKERRHENLSIVHTNEQITNHDDPATAIRQKPNASMSLALKIVKNRGADAIVSAGNTGAYLSGAVLILGRLKGVIRPALASVIPTSKNTKSLALDLGANSESTAIILHQYGVIGTVIAEKYLNIETPSVGLLNNGGEEKKGTPIHKEAYSLLNNDKNINFFGNIEGRDFASGEVDVIVADGFSGNIALKTLEGALRFIRDLLTLELKKSVFRKIKAGIAMLLLGSTLKKIIKDNSEEAVGGAILAGVKAPVVKAHGNSNEIAYLSAIQIAQTFIEKSIPYMIAEAIENDSKN